MLAGHDIAAYPCSSYSQQLRPEWGFPVALSLHFQAEAVSNAWLPGMYIVGQASGYL